MVILSMMQKLEVSSSLVYFKEISGKGKRVPEPFLNIHSAPQITVYPSFALYHRLD
jgi:hypothetical protein